MSSRVLIVGAGLGGLTLAQVLVQAGVQVRVIEKVPAWRPVGAGLILSGNALRVLGRLGLDQAAIQAGQRLDSARLTDAAGRPIQTLVYPESAPVVALHRAALHEVLSQDLAPHIQLGTTVVALRQDARCVKVTLSDDTEHEVDVVVGADGLHSAVRGLVFAGARPRYAGYTSWRFVVDQPAHTPHAVEMWGRGCRLGLVPLRGGQTYGYVTANAPQGQVEAPQDRARDLRTRCAEFGGPAPALLEQLVSTTAVIRTDIHEVRLRCWAHGRVALLGDAAHAMTPNLGQGAAMSLEDAVVLGGQLISCPDISVALARYQAIRTGRVAQVQTVSRLLGRAGQLEATWLRTLRDTGMRLTPPGLSRHPAQALADVALD